MYKLTFKTNTNNKFKFRLESFSRLAKFVHWLVSLHFLCLVVTLWASRNSRSSGGRHLVGQGAEQGHSGIVLVIVAQVVGVQLLVPGQRQTTALLVIILRG